MSSRTQRWATGAFLVVVVTFIAVMTLKPSPRTLTIPVPALCMQCGARLLSDVISNIVLFLPLGIAFVLRGKRVVRAVVYGMLFSCGIELLQFAVPSLLRTPSITDVVTNSTGTFLGAVLATQWHWLVSPSVHTARKLVLAWTVAVIGMFGATVWALSPSERAVAPGGLVQLSSLPFTPHYGWFAGVADRAFMNGVSVPHAGSGPVIVNMGRTDTIRVSVLVNGRDPRERTVPIVYAHGADPVVPHTLLGQRGADAVLELGLNAKRIGLAQPILTLRNAFAPRARMADSSRPYVQLDGSVHDGLLALSARRFRGEGAADVRTLVPDGTVSAIFALTPALGWALIQSLVGVDSPASDALTALWLFLWCVPVGYWGFRALRAGPVALETRLTGSRVSWWRTAFVATAWLVGVMAICYAFSWRAAIQPLAVWHVVMCGVSLYVGMGLNWRRD